MTGPFVLNRQVFLSIKSYIIIQNLCKISMKGDDDSMIDRNEISKEMLEKALECKTADELIELAKTKDIELTKDEAEAYLEELADIEMDEKVLKRGRSLHVT